MNSKLSTHPDDVAGGRLQIGTPAISDHERFKVAEEELLRQCSLDQNTKERLFKVLDNFRNRADNVEDMLVMFGNKCFKSEPTSQARYKASFDFCRSAFGN